MAERKIVPLTVDSVVSALKQVYQNWKELSVCLGIPASIQDQIHHQSSTDEECILSLVQWWMKEHPSPSWRRILWALDELADGIGLRVVDEMHHYAEPLTGKAYSLMLCRDFTVWIPCSVLYAPVYKSFE